MLRLFFLLLLAGNVLACDTCGCALVPVDERSVAKGWRMGVGKQVSFFDHLQTESVRVANGADQHFASSATQYQIGYNFNEKAGVQVLVPYLDKRYRRVFDDGTIHNWEKEITAADLPNAVKQTVMVKFPKATMKEIMQVTEVKEGKETIEGYEILLKPVHKKEVEVTVAPDGKILEEDSGKETGKEKK